MLPRIHRCAAWTLLSGTLLFISAGSVRAQTEPVSPCGVEAAEGSDSTAVRSNKFEQAFFSLLFAPPLIFSVLDSHCGESGNSLGFWKQHVSLSVSAAYLTNGDQEPSEVYNVGGHLATLELLVRGVYGELRFEQYSLEGGTSLQTFRFGYLAHPLPRVAAGATVGYRRGPNGSGLWETTGIELALPIVYAFGASPRSGWVRWEPTYVVTSNRLVLAPRINVEIPLRRTPLVAHFGLDVKGIRARDPLVLSSGLRFRI